MLVHFIIFSIFIEYVHGRSQVHSGSRSNPVKFSEFVELFVLIILIKSISIRAYFCKNMNHILLRYFGFFLQKIHATVCRRMNEALTLLAQIPKSIKYDEFLKASSFGKFFLILII